MTQTYCEASDVKRVMGLTYAFSEDTTPSLADVNEMIEDAEDDINNVTMHSWKEVSIQNEYHNFPKNNAISLSSTYKYGAGVRISLGNRKIKTMDSDEGDQLLVWDGDEYEDFLLTRTEGRNEDFWFDYDQGYLYLKQRRKFSVEKAIKIDYRFGETTVPRDIKKATALSVAMEIIAGDDQSQATDESGDFKTFSHDTKYSKWRAKYNKIISGHKEYKLINF